MTFDTEYCLIYCDFRKRCPKSSFNDSCFQYRLVAWVTRGLQCDKRGSFSAIFISSDALSSPTFLNMLKRCLVEIYKTINHLNPPYLREIFIKKMLSYDLHIRQLCRLPTVNSKKCGASSLAFRGSLLWNTLILPRVRTLAAKVPRSIRGLSVATIGFASVS